MRFYIAMIYYLIIIILLLAVSAFVSASEVAFFSLTPAHHEELDDSEQPADIRINTLLKDPQKLLATILIANNFVNVAIIVLSSIVISQAFDFSSKPWLGFLVESVLITFVILLFGEIMPKIFAQQHSLLLCRKASGILMPLEYLLYPFSYILIHSTSFIDKRIEKHTHNTLSMDELSHALELTEDTIDEDKDILQGIVKFGTQTAASVMTPRTDMITVSVTDSFDSVINCINEHEYSRIPVLKGSYDDIRGILYAKDLLPFIEKPKNFKWQTLIRQAYFVPETKKIDDLLQDFQKNRVHMAIVVDEFGGTSGLVTMEDVLEEVVGDISDEYDTDDMSCVAEDDTHFSVEAKISLTDLVKDANLDDEIFDELEEIDTLAGLILEIKGEFPVLHEHILYRNLDFEITAIDARRIQKVRMTVNPVENNDEN